MLKLKRFTLSVITVMLMLALSEVVLRQFFGNLAVGELFQSQPGDGRCVALKPGATVEYTGHWRRTAPVTQEVNAQGFRGRTVPEKRPTPSIRIAVLGDSLVYGVGAIEVDTFASRMQDML